MLQRFKSVTQLAFVCPHPKDHSGSGPRGATNKTCSQQKASKGGVVMDGGGKSPDVHFSVCLLLLSPFPVFNLVNTYCSYNMLQRQHPHASRAFTRFNLSLPQSVCLLVEAAAALSSLIVPRLAPTPVPHHEPPLRLWSAERQ